MLWHNKLHHNPNPTSSQKQIHKPNFKSVWQSKTTRPYVSLVCPERFFLQIFFRSNMQELLFLTFSSLCTCLAFWLVHFLHDKIVFFLRSWHTQDRIEGLWTDLGFPKELTLICLPNMHLLIKGSIILEVITVRHHIVINSRCTGNKPKWNLFIFIHPCTAWVIQIYLQLNAKKINK